MDTQIPLFVRVKILILISVSNSLIAADKLGWETKSFFAASLMEPLSAIAIADLSCYKAIQSPTNLLSTHFCLSGQRELSATQILFSPSARVDLGHARLRRM